MLVGVMPPGKLSAIYERDACIVAEIRARGVASWDQVYPAVRRATGATAHQVRGAMERMAKAGRLELVEKANRWGKSAMYRVVKETAE